MVSKVWGSRETQEAFKGKNVWVKKQLRIEMQEARIIFVLNSIVSMMMRPTFKLSCNKVEAIFKIVKLKKNEVGSTHILKVFSTSKVPRLQYEDMFKLGLVDFMQVALGSKSSSKVKTNGKKIRDWIWVQNWTWFQVQVQKHNGQAIFGAKSKSVNTRNSSPSLSSKRTQVQVQIRDGQIAFGIIGAKNSLADARNLSLSLGSKKPKRKPKLAFEFFNRQILFNAQNNSIVEKSECKLLNPSSSLSLHLNFLLLKYFWC